MSQTFDGIAAFILPEPEGEQIDGDTSEILDSEHTED